jgi:hypothetical protein
MAEPVVKSATDSNLNKLHCVRTLARAFRRFDRAGRLPALRYADHTFLAAAADLIQGIDDGTNAEWIGRDRPQGAAVVDSLGDFDNASDIVAKFLAKGEIARILKVAQQRDLATATIQDCGITCPLS